MTQQPTTTRRRWLVGAMIVLLPAVVLAGAWRLGGVSALEDDLIYYLPIRQYIGECLRGGELPVWNPWVAMGTSIAADPQSGLWYPPTWLFAVLPPLWAYPATVALHFALAGAGMYRFLRTGRHRWQVALFGALAFELSGFLVAHRVHLTMLEAAAWLPWMLYAWSRFAHRGAYDDSDGWHLTVAAAPRLRRAQPSRGGRGPKPYRCPAAARGGGRYETALSYYRHLALAVVCLGLQMLVQHIQVSIISVALVSGYVLVVLLPQRRALLWQYPAGLALGLALASIQILPTWLHYASTARGTPAYHLFIENSWSPTSALLFLFPMLFGSRTPNVWSQPWWGVSHFCEQAAYASLVVLVLAGASLALLTMRRETARRREVLFWWVAMAVALLLALGQFTPLSRVLFHVPVYQSLRVPARWILVWSVGLPILASIALTVAMRDDPAAMRVRRAIRILATRILPALFVGSLILLVAARLLSGTLSQRLTGYRAAEFWQGLCTAVRPGNPALWWPLLLMGATAYALTAWLRSLTPTGGGHRCGANRCGTGVSPVRWLILCSVLLVDLAAVAAFVDVDTRTYRRADLRKPPPLTEAIAALEPQPGERLLVPRAAADYNRPLEVLWPQTNIQHRVATFQGYGPFWPVANRLLLRFMPWGSSEEIVWLLHRPDLCRALGIRFLVVRSAQERAVLDTEKGDTEKGSGAVLEGQPLGAVPPKRLLTPFVLRAGEDLLWPVHIDRPGLYTLQLHAEPGPTPAHRWFVRIETPDGLPITDTRTIEPVDLALGPRQIRFLFACEQAFGPAQVRIKAERGEPVRIRDGSFAQVADDRGPAAGSFHHRADLPGGIELYELPDPLPWARWASRIEVVPTLLDAVSRLQESPGRDGPPLTVVEAAADLGDLTAEGDRSVTWSRPTGHEVLLTTVSTRPGVLMINESFDAGWHAEMEGEAVPIYRVNAVVQGLVLPEGRHSITLRYRPPGLTAGATVSVVSGLVLLAGLIRCGVGRSAGRRKGSVKHGERCA